LQRFVIAKRVWLGLLLSFCAVYLYGLGHFPLVGPDEPRYAQVGREMFTRGDFVTPTLGGHTWFEKPALLYWMMMGSYSIFGVSEFSARLGPALCGVLTVLLIFWLSGKAEGPEAGQEKSLSLVTGLVMASCGGMIAFSRGASFDVVVTMTVTLALACFFVADIETEAKRKKVFLAGFYVAVGLSLLAKGLIGIVIPFGVVGFFLALQKRWPSRDYLTSLLWGIPLCVAVASVWYGPVIARHGWTFINEFFIQHHFARYVSNKYHHPQPFYYYLLVIWLLALPWSVFLLGALVHKRAFKLRSESIPRRLDLFAISWLVVPLAFFSISGSKLPGYILPALPAAALLAGRRLTSFVTGQGPKWEMRITGALVLVAGIGAAGYFWYSGLVSHGSAATVGLPAAIAGAAALLWSKERQLTTAVLVVAMMLTAVISLNGAATNLADRESMKRLLDAAAAQGYGSAPVLQMHVIERTSEFYAAGRLDRGPDGEVIKLDGPSPVVESARAHTGPLLVTIPLEYLSQLTENPELESRVIGDNRSIALVVVRAKSSSGTGSDRSNPRDKTDSAHLVATGRRTECPGNALAPPSAYLRLLSKKSITIRS
jgi:4-amino-4-deoxy-L-arabinose transferase-like glycosyltransferase